MTYTAAEARAQLLEGLVEPIDDLALALACLGEAYEQMDSNMADRLEAELFRSVQLAYGRLKRLHSSFAERHGLAAHTFEAVAPGVPSQGAKEFVSRGAEAARRAGDAIAQLQNSMLPHEVGDRHLREGLVEIRELVEPLPARARELMRTFGR